MAVVAVDRLSKRYDGGSEPAVKEVSFTVAEGEFMVLLGPSGCGKSSVLRMIAGLEPITAGTVSVDGRVINQVPARDRDIAMVFQSYALYPHMDVYNNLAFGLRRRSVPSAEIDRRVRSVAGRLGLAPFLARKPHALSGGQRQRVALGRAIVRDPKVFLFDEPLSNLDAKLRVQMRVELKKLHERLAVTSVYVTHDQVEAMTLGDRVVVMKDGVVQQVGEPLELYNRPANRFVAGFIGSPAMNFADVTLADGGGRVTAEAQGLRICLPDALASRARSKAGRKATLGIRPEDIRVANAGDSADHCFEAEVEVVEQLGSEILLDTRVGPALMAASIDPESKVHAHDRLRLALNPARLHLFDAETEAAI